MFVGKFNDRDFTGEPPGKKHPLAGQQAGGVVQPFSAVVVAGNRQHRDAAPGQLVQKPVQQQHRAGRRDRRIVDVAGHRKGIDAVLVAQGKEFFEDVALVFQQIEAVDPLAEVQVGNVQKLHRQSFSQVVKSRVTPGSTSTGAVPAARNRHRLQKPSALRSFAQTFK